MKLVFATGNSGKLREASEILGEGFELVTPAQEGITEEISETGNTLRENSLQKAKYIFDHTDGADCFADDTGLEVDILKGAPGVYSARYAGPSKSFEANMDKLLKEMALHEYEASVAREFGIATPKATRRARFKTVVTLILNGEKHFFEGTMEGKISYVKAGHGGFGYDPVFIADEYPDVTVAEITEEQKKINGFSAFKGSDNNFYIKVESAESYSSERNKYKFQDGTEIENGKEYFFRLEPIKWRILSGNGTNQNAGKDKQLWYKQLLNKQLLNNSKHLAIFGETD